MSGIQKGGPIQIAKPFFRTSLKPLGTFDKRVPTALFLAQKYQEKGYLTTKNKNMKQNKQKIDNNEQKL